MLNICGKIILYDVSSCSKASGFFIFLIFNFLILCVVSRFLFLFFLLELPVRKWAKGLKVQPLIGLVF